MGAVGGSEQRRDRTRLWFSQDRSACCTESGLWETNREAGSQQGSHLVVLVEDGGAWDRVGAAGVGRLGLKGFEGETPHSLRMD